MSYSKNHIILMSCLHKFSKRANLATLLLPKAGVGSKMDPQMEQEEDRKNHKTGALGVQKSIPAPDHIFSLMHSWSKAKEQTN